MSVLLYVFTAIAGVLNTLQAGQNTTLKTSLGSPLLAAIIVAAAGSLVYVAAIPLVGIRFPDAAKFASVPWWAWFGGMLGGIYVLTTIYVADRVGAATFTGITVTAAIVTSIALDHFGLVGFTVHPAGVGRIAGGIIMVAGLLLVCLT